MKVLVKFSSNWADEFDLEGFKIYTIEEWEKAKEQAKEVFAETEKENIKRRAEATIKSVADPNGFHYVREAEMEFYFGTNEAMHYSGYQQWLNDCKVMPISEEEVKVIDKFLNPGDYGYGIFIQPYNYY